MHWIDWSIIIGLVLFVTWMAMRTKRYTKSVADFLAANRCAGRYLLGTAEGTAALGAISVIAQFEAFYAAGFAPGYWQAMAVPILLFVQLSGWVIYRYRATRAMTMSQFFEMRYSKRFRVFTGMIAWLAGVINFGIFPGVGARFFINYCGIPEIAVWQIGPFTVSVTLAVTMLALLGIALFFTFMGGQIAVLVTDFWQGFFTTIVATIIVFYLLWKFPWTIISEGAKLASVPGKSLIDPFDIGQARDFNIWFFVITWFFVLYHYMAWQGQQGYNCSATTPHEAKMSKVVGALRSKMITMGFMLVPLCALVFMNHPDFVDGANEVRRHLVETFPNNIRLQGQLRVPVVMAQIFPVGLLGAFAAAMLGFFISTHDTYLHSWGSIFIQDVLIPLRKKPLETKQHLKWLRISIIGVAIFIFLFSLLFPVQDYIYMFFAITGAFYLGGAGACIIGGLYWKRGTTAGAWTAMILGAILSLSSIIIQQIPFTKIDMAIDAPADVETVEVNGIAATRNGTTWNLSVPIKREDDWLPVRIEAKGPDGKHREQLNYAFFADAEDGAPEQPLTDIQVQALTSNQVELTWSGVVPEANMLIIERSTDGHVYEQIAEIGVAQSSFVDEEVTPTSTYHYRIISKNDNGLSFPSFSREIQTPPLRPAQPASFEALVLADNQVRLSWKTADDATGYLIEKSPDGVNYSLLKQVGPTTKLFLDDSVDSEQSWFYRLSAINNAGTSDYTPRQLARTQKRTLGAPAALDVVSADRKAVSLTWQPSMVNPGTSFVLERSRNELSYEKIVSGDTSFTSYKDTNVVAGEVYYYRVKMLDGENESYPSRIAKAETIPSTEYTLAISPAHGTVIPAAPGLLSRLFVIFRAMNGQVAAFWCAMTGILGYVLISLLTRQPEFEMDELLHRGKYRIKEEEEEIEKHADHKEIGAFWRFLGVNSHEFSRVDKGLFMYSFILGVYTMGSFAVLMILHFAGWMNPDRWIIWWKYGLIGVHLTIAIVGAIWVSVGGLLDLKYMYARLRNARRIEDDDGSVSKDEHFGSSSDN